MNFDLFTVPQDIDLFLLAPIILVVLTGFVAMTIELLRPKQPNGPIIATSIVGLLMAGLVGYAQLDGGEDTAFSGMIFRDRLGMVGQLILIAACLLTILFSERYLRAKRIPFAEFYFLCLWATAGAMVMVTTKNLLVIFVGLEILSISLYVLAGLCRQESKSEEAALKYFLLGAFASAILLYGISLLYGASGSVDLNDLAAALRSGRGDVTTLVVMGIGLLVIGLGFKSALVPFHQWTPDVYQGAPTNVTAYMSVASKAAAMLVLTRLLLAAAPLQQIWMPALSVIAILTMVVGNSVALLQKDIKRILAYSSIAHAGYILTAILAHVKAGTTGGQGTLLYYLVSYTFMTIGAFAVVSAVARDGKESTNIDDLKGLWKRSPFAAVALLLFMVSLIGIPPFAGFWGKLLIFKDALAAGLPALAIVLAATSILSVAYYLQVAWAAFVADESDEKPALQLDKGLLAACVLCIAGVVILGVFVGPAYDALSIGRTTLFTSN